jgi:ribonuclease HII
MVQIMALLLDINYKLSLSHIGVDEVGYGAWAGPLLICALKFFQEPDFLLYDSKKITPRKREEIFEKLKLCARWQLGFAQVDEINKYGLARAYKLALNRALDDFQGEIFIDGRKPKDLDCTAIIKGDSLVPAISAASIVAKVIRDNLMQELHIEFPEYNFKENKGYGTKKHIEAIGRLGLSSVHRSSYNLGKYLNS